MPPRFSPSRRALLRSCAYGAVISALAGSRVSIAATLSEISSLASPRAPLTLNGCALSEGDDVSVPEGYAYRTLIAWGDKLHAEGTADLAALTPEEQEACFGYNNDFLCLLPGRTSDEALLFVNHESPESKLMFPSGGAADDPVFRAKVEMAALGASLVALKKSKNGEWTVKRGDPRNRRWTAKTQCIFTGPAAGHERLRTSADTAGVAPRGTFGNCSGGVTPWGTALTAEENVDDFFCLPKGTQGPEALKAAAFGVTASPAYSWNLADKRFDLSEEPNEINRFGWIVEIDPSSPAEPPRKLTALGRFKHEGALTTLTADNRLAVFMGDDEAFKSLYRYVSREPYAPGASAEALRRLTEDGTLSAAELHDNGSLVWKDLVHGENGLTEASGFFSQADILIDTREAAVKAGATAMDRPEGIARCPSAGDLFVSLTKNPMRAAPSPGNPRPFNRHGHILRIRPENGDAGSRNAVWEIAFYGGAGGANTAKSAAAPEDAQADPLTVLSCPDNMAFDRSGMLWVCTDGMEDAAGVNDGVYRLDVGKPSPEARRFLTVPKGAEATGPAFSEDGETFFLSVQHPARGSSWEKPAHRWPDQDPAKPPRPAVIAVRKTPSV